MLVWTGITWDRDIRWWNEKHVVHDVCKAPRTGKVWRDPFVCEGASRDQLGSDGNERTEEEEMSRPGEGTE